VRRLHTAAFHIKKTPPMATTAPAMQEFLSPHPSVHRPDGDAKGMQATSDQHHRGNAVAHRHDLQWLGDI